MSGYCGRFAPSPTGPLHAGSLVAALASWLDARAHGGVWLLRLENVDTPRCVPGADQTIIAQLARCGLHPDAAPTWQSAHTPRYAAALEQLRLRGWAYPCRCSRKAIDAASAATGLLRQRHGERVYPGTCRPRTASLALGASAAPADAHAASPNPHNNAALDPLPAAAHTAHISPCAWRLHVGALQQALGLDARTHWQDRRLGPQQQDVLHAVGDFVLQRADGLWAYQLAVVVDDAAQGITHVVRGADLADNSARQLLLQAALDLPTPRYLHTPLVLGPDGSKLSKQNGAAALDLSDPLAALRAAAAVLGLSSAGADLGAALAAWVQEWRARWVA